jgi:hypothetical protein
MKNSTVNVELVSLKHKDASGKGGRIEVIRPSKLAEAGVKGLVAEGTLEKIEPNEFDAGKNDYFLRGSDNTLYIINETKSIKEQLSDPNLLGKRIQINYDGKLKTKNGKGFHDFSCFLVK